MGCLGWLLVFLGILTMVVTLGTLFPLYVPLLIVGVLLVVVGSRRSQDRRLERMAAKLLQVGKGRRSPSRPPEPPPPPVKGSP